MNGEYIIDSYLDWYFNDEDEIRQYEESWKEYYRSKENELN